MKKMKASVTSVVLLCALLSGGAFGRAAAMEKAPGDEEIGVIDIRQIPRISVDELKSHLNDPSLVVIDVRTGASWDESATKIRGAFREAYERTEEWAPKYDRGKTIVLYCT